MRLAPIILFVYNRPEHTLKTLSALQKNELASQSELYIFSDGSKNESDKELVNTVRKIISTCSGFKNITIHSQEINKGLANSIISGVTEIITIHERVIVLEDDIITEPSFLSFCNNALSFYEDKKDIFSISGYSFPIEIPNNYPNDIYTARRASSWGWCTWKDRWLLNDWEMKDFDTFILNPVAIKEFNKGGVDLTNMLQKQMLGKINSWAIRWCYTHFKNNAVCLYPTVSLVDNIGNDNSGTHSPGLSKYNAKKTTTAADIQLEYPVIKNEIIEDRLRVFFKKKWTDRIEYVIRKILKK